MRYVLIIFLWFSFLIIQSPIKPDPSRLSHPHTPSFWQILLLIPALEVLALLDNSPPLISSPIILFLVLVILLRQGHMHILVFVVPVLACSGVGSPLLCSAPSPSWLVVLLHQGYMRILLLPPPILV